MNYTQLGEICNLWRNYGDIQDSWDSVLSIIDWFFNNQDVISPAAGPGRWNDPDMVSSSQLDSIVLVLQFISSLLMCRRRTGSDDSVFNDAPRHMRAAPQPQLVPAPSGFPVSIAITPLHFSHFFFLLASQKQKDFIVCGGSS